MPSPPAVSTNSAPYARSRIRRSSGRRDHGERDARVAAGGFDDRSTGLQCASLLCGIDDGNTEAVFHARRGVVELELRENGCTSSIRDFVEPDERCLAEDFGDVVVDVSSHENVPVSNAEDGDF
jgi:hypothetical protein